MVLDLIKLMGLFIDYVEREKRLKQIGELGEQFIFSQEREKVKQYHLPSNKKVAWVSRDKGDGLGFDILSYDAEGNELGTHVACYDYKGNMKWEYLVQDDVIYYAEAGEEL